MGAARMGARQKRQIKAYNSGGAQRHGLAAALGLAKGMQQQQYRSGKAQYKAG